MGHMSHHAVIVTGCYGNYLAEAHAMASEIFPVVSPIMDARINAIQTFVIPPDGSKEGWADSDEGDRQRERFISYLESLRYEDHSSPLDWAEVQYGDDNGDDGVLRSSDRHEEEEQPDEDDGPEPISWVPDLLPGKP